MTRVHLSRVDTGFWKPHNASTNSVCIYMKRCSPHQIKTSRSFWCNTVISPNSSPSSWSPTPWNVTFWLSFMPCQYELLEFSSLELFPCIAAFTAIFRTDPLPTVLALPAYGLDMLSHSSPFLMNSYLQSPYLSNWTAHYCSFLTTLSSTNHFILQSQFTWCTIVWLF